ncbi:MAG: ATP-binding cassette domain-containing protein, partial [Firmicutes bacterium]|nr:ATP-binding cassette domain-containing protein [Bacillota bacterium]
LLPAFTALENAMLPLILEGVAPREREKKGRALLQQVGLAERLQHKPSELSGGQRQRVSIARALINNPRIIFADEPTGNLDSKTAEEILELLISTIRAQGQTMLMVTHDANVAGHADRIIEMVDGQIINYEQKNT